MKLRARRLASTEPKQQQHVSDAKQSNVITWVPGGKAKGKAPNLFRFMLHCRRSESVSSESRVHETLPNRHYRHKVVSACCRFVFFCASVLYFWFEEF